MQIFLTFIHKCASNIIIYVCTIRMYMHICIVLNFYIAAPDGVDMVNIMCGPVDVINQCTVTWNVSV